LIVGKDIRRWRIESKQKYLIFTRRGIDINNYPAIKNYLMQWKTELTPKSSSNQTVGRKAGSYKWYEIQDNVAYYDEFDKPKIVFPDIANEHRFTLDRECSYFANTAYVIPGEDLYLLGILNSSQAKQFYIELSSQVRGGYL
jgi:hypothetical protein